MREWHEFMGKFDHHPLLTGDRAVLQTLLRHSDCSTCSGRCRTSRWSRASQDDGSRTTRTAAMATKPRNEPVRRHGGSGVSGAGRSHTRDLEAARADLVEAVAAVIFTAGEDFGSARHDSRQEAACCCPRASRRHAVYPERQGSANPAIPARPSVLMSLSCRRDSFARTEAQTWPHRIPSPPPRSTATFSRQPSTRRLHLLDRRRPTPFANSLTRYAVRHHHRRVRRHHRDDRRGLDQRDRPEARRAHRLRFPRGRPPRNSPGIAMISDRGDPRHQRRPARPRSSASCGRTSVARWTTGCCTATSRRSRSGVFTFAAAVDRAPTCGPPCTTRRPTSSPAGGTPDHAGAAAVRDRGRGGPAGRRPAPDVPGRADPLRRARRGARSRRWLAAEGLVYDRTPAATSWSPKTSGSSPVTRLRPRVPAGQRGAAGLRPVRGGGAGPGGAASAS